MWTIGPLFSCEGAIAERIRQRMITKTGLRHRWALTPHQAMRLQSRLARRVIQAPLAKPPRYVAGGDVAFFNEGGRLIAGWVVWDLRRREVIDSAIEDRAVTFPYVPGLLSFREAPALLAAARKLTTEPDVFMLDGQGLAHPRRFGLACHVGLLLDRPAMGCAKRRLCGEHRPPGPNRGCSTQLLDEGEVIGRVVRTRTGVKPVFVSVGHRLTLQDAVRLTVAGTGDYRLPEPTRHAHRFVTNCRNERIVE